MDDYWVEARSDEEIRSICKRALQNLGLALHSTIDICSVVRAREVFTVFGIKRLTFEELDDVDMEVDDGRTVYARDTVSIQVRKSVGAAARAGSPRARMTLAHELGHGYLHQGLTLHRKTIEPLRPAHIPPARSAEHQAKVFGAAFLMPDELVADCKTATDIATKCLVSAEAARIRFELLCRASRRLEMAQRMKVLARELRKSSASAPDEAKFILEPCTSCGQSKVFPVGSKFMCQNCDRVSDGFQDGD